jgi:FKBP-type peptidyl-prolyl cis-trans isomerase FkpA
MKNLLVIAALMMVSLSCKKSDGCTGVDPSAEDAKMLAFASQNGYTVTKHSTGMYYQVLNAGSGATPTLGSKVYITYTGKFLDGTVFDSSTNPSSTAAGNATLNDFIEGWKIGIPLIKKGGSIRLIIPSSLAYGCSGRGSIPANTVLYFDVNLIDVQ